MLRRMHTGGEFERKILFIEVVFCLEVLDEFLCLLNQKLLMYFFVVCKFFEMLTQIGTKVPEYGPAINEFKLLPFVLVWHFAWTILAALMTTEHTRVKLETLLALVFIMPLLTYWLFFRFFGVNRKCVHLTHQTCVELKRLKFERRLQFFRDLLTTLVQDNFVDDLLNAHLLRICYTAGYYIRERIGQICLIGDWFPEFLRCNGRFGRGQLLNWQLPVIALS